MRFKRARRPLENTILVATLAVLAFLFYELGSDTNGWTIFFLVLLGLCYIRLIQGQYVGNSLEVSHTQFDLLKTVIAEYAVMLRIPEPKLFVYQDPNPNAFTLGFKHPYSIIVASSLLEGLEEAEVRAVLGHEIGHAFFHHPRISSLITIAGNGIPGLTWVFGFWQRSAELSADRLSTMLTNQPGDLITALTRISVGMKFLKEINWKSLHDQQGEVRYSLMNRLGEQLIDHPYLTTRIVKINEFYTHLKAGL